MNYLSLAFSLSKRQFSQNYKNSIFGLGWIFVHPIVVISTYILIFSAVFASKMSYLGSAVSYGLYLCVGIVFWGYFNEIIANCMGAIRTNSNMIKKIKFPLSTVFVSAIFMASFNFVVIFSIFVIFFLFAGSPLKIDMILLLPLLFVQIFFATTIGVFTGLLCVLIRDVTEFMKVLMHLWLWVTPIVYPLSILPDKIQSAMNLNPLFPIIKSFHAILLGGSQVDWFSLSYPIAGGFVIFFLNIGIISRFKTELMDEL